MYESGGSRWVEGRREKGEREGEEGVREREKWGRGWVQKVHLA